MELFVIWIFIITIIQSICFADRKFEIRYEEDSFYMDGKPFRYVSGSAHYFRLPHQYWRDRLRKIRAGGLNAVSTYVEWSQHEPIPGTYDFSGDLNVTRFIEIAQEEGLYVILRPGPYICAERDMGGLPYWLLTKNPDVVLRTKDPKYTEYVEKWMKVLFEKIRPQLYGNGGPIILVQVENEYGYYHACDHAHNLWLRDLFKNYIKDDAVLFTTDPPANRSLHCGKIPGVYATVDFGPDFNVEKSFSFQRLYEPRGPLVNSEYYCGWFTHWGERLAGKKTPIIINKLKDMLSKGANVNFYMYFGGTNFGFTAGANMFLKYQSDITSYDYDAPISEAGDLTDKYYAIKDTLARFLEPPKNISVQTHEKANYGELTLKVVATLMSPFVKSSLGVFHRSEYPQSFEELNQNFGYILYETDLRKNFTEPKDYIIRSYNDYANIYLDGNLVKTISREKQERNFTLNATTPGQILSILVENLGRVNSGWILYEQKGLLSNVTRKGKVLDTWNMTGFELKSLTPIQKCFTSHIPECNNGHGFHIYMTSFVVPDNATKNEYGYLLDSFLDVRQLTKGLIFINDFNLGRYWSTRGPQYTLYVPGVYIKPYPQENTLVIMDENIRLENIKISFTKKPIFMEPTAEKLLTNK